MFLFSSLTPEPVSQTRPTSCEVYDSSAQVFPFVCCQGALFFHLWYSRISQIKMRGYITIHIPSKITIRKPHDKSGGIQNNKFPDTIRMVHTLANLHHNKYPRQQNNRIEQLPLEQLEKVTSYDRRCREVLTFSITDRLFLRGKNSQNKCYSFTCNTKRSNKKIVFYFLNRWTPPPIGNF